MPTWRKKPANRQYLNKRYTPEQQQARSNAARDAVRRLYCDVLGLWRTCAGKPCRRHRRCTGDSGRCFDRVRWDNAVHDVQVCAQVIAGGPRRVPLGTHTEWGMRRWPPSSL